ncbi:hypothetical protein [Spiroplasma sp. DGKH1]|uniref:hypothetical protein n=1 Tax=Spiroplasma sp. DGKH1 TaxID=3050074 RepID=UPI0034C6A8D9
MKILLSLISSAAIVGGTSGALAPINHHNVVNKNLGEIPAFNQTVINAVKNEVTADFMMYQPKPDVSHAKIAVITPQNFTSNFVKSFVDFAGTTHTGTLWQVQMIIQVTYVIHEESPVTITINGEFAYYDAIAQHAYTNIPWSNYIL